MSGPVDQRRQGRGGEREGGGKQNRAVACDLERTQAGLPHNAPGNRQRLRAALYGGETGNPERAGRSGEYAGLMQLGKSAGGRFAIAKHHGSAPPVQRRRETQMQQETNLIRRGVKQN